jgi:hypothetical protein
MLMKICIESTKNYSFLLRTAANYEFLTAYPTILAAYKSLNCSVFSLLPQLQNEFNRL